MLKFNQSHLKKLLSIGLISLSLLSPLSIHSTYANSVNNTQITPLQLIQITQNIKLNMSQRNLSANEKNLYRKLYDIANNSPSLYNPAIQSPTEQYEYIRKQIRQQFVTVKQLAAQTYGANAQQKNLLATNAFILMYYDALSRKNPNFYWPNLGVFVANDVRSNYALTFSLSNALDPLKLSNSQNIIIAGKNIPTLQNTIMQANQALIQGQADVMADIGGLSILHQHYDSAELATVLSPYGANLRKAFLLQKIADEYAKSNGNTDKQFKRLATDAAIGFGIHEQEKILQPMWDQALMHDFAKINDFMLSLSLENVGLRGDIFLGVNKFKLIFTPYLIIRAPLSATNLASLQDRIAIARNGFTVLNEWKSNPAYSRWIPIYQNQIGQGKGLYEPIGAR